MAWKSLLEYWRDFESGFKDYARGGPRQWTCVGRRYIPHGRVSEKLGILLSLTEPWYGFAAALQAQIGDPVYEVRVIYFDDGEDVREKGLLATVFICWKGWEWVDAGQVNEQWTRVMMPEPSASRENRGLMRCGYGHNEVCSKRRSHVVGNH
jgi:hypothetical protein